MCNHEKNHRRFRGPPAFFCPFRESTWAATHSIPCAAVESELRLPMNNRGTERQLRRSSKHRVDQRIECTLPSGGRGQREVL